MWKYVSASETSNNQAGSLRTRLFLSLTVSAEALGPQARALEERFSSYAFLQFLVSNISVNDPNSHLLAQIK